MTIQVETTSTAIQIKDANGYFALIQLANGAHPITFHDASEQGYGFTTCRPAYYYPACAQEAARAGKLIADVGCGLSGFIPFAARYSKPLAIDFCNYRKMQELLRHSLALRLPRQLKRHARELLKRCAIYLNPYKVQLVNKKLGTALKENPELIGSVDVVVDNFGPSYYQGTERPCHRTSPAAEIESLERRLLKPTGTLCVSWPSVLELQVQVIQI